MAQINCRVIIFLTSWFCFSKKSKFFRSNVCTFEGSFFERKKMSQQPLYPQPAYGKFWFVFPPLFFVWVFVILVCLCCRTVSSRSAAVYAWSRHAWSWHDSSSSTWWKRLHRQPKSSSHSADSSPAHQCKKRRLKRTENATKETRKRTNKKKKKKKKNKKKKKKKKKQKKNKKRFLLRWWPLLSVCFLEEQCLLRQACPFLQPLPLLPTSSSSSSSSS